MEYRFDLQDANFVANLACGRAAACYETVYSSEDNYYKALECLKAFSNDLYSDKFEKHRRALNFAIAVVREQPYTNDREFSDEDVIGQEVLKVFSSVSDVLNSCRIKALLLPPIHDDDNNEYSFMTSPETLKKLYDLMSCDSCLIIQPKADAEQQDLMIFNAFPFIEKALKQIDRWPAVLFWDAQGNNELVQVKSEKDLSDLFQSVIADIESNNSDNAFRKMKIYSRRIHRSRSPFKSVAAPRESTGHYYIQLSDLHFGAKNVSTTSKRLKAMIEKEIRDISGKENIDKPDVDIIITGDGVDSPNPQNNALLRQFLQELEELCGRKPIVVLGNHDVHEHGLALGNIEINDHAVLEKTGNFPSIVVNEKEKIIFLLFNSNTDGALAQGEIGQKQMAEMGSKLDEVENITDYKLVAVLHHHISTIPAPDFYLKPWYAKFIPDEVFDTTLQLNDADIFTQWLKNRNVKLVLHGHKHFPLISEYKGINIVSCGSSTGQFTHVDSRKTCLSYDVLKFQKNKVICTQIVETILGAGKDEKNCRVCIINL